MHSNKTTADTLARTGIAPLLKDAGPGERERERERE